MKKRVLLTGAGGQLGHAIDLHLSPRWELHPKTRQELNICSAAAVKETLEALRPAWVINAAAWTQVDSAEAHRQEVFRVNDTAVGYLADAAASVGARLVQYSTDYVFDGRSQKPYVEKDPPAPLNVYGASKLAMEKRLLAHPVGAAILRTSWLYSELEGNFFRTMMKLGASAEETGEPLRVVDDQLGTPTDTHTLAVQTEEVMIRGLSGLLHASCEGQASWWRFAQTIFQLCGLHVPLLPIRTVDFPRVAQRPLFSVLENLSLKRLKANRMGPWKSGLRAVIERYKEARTEEEF